MHSNPHPRSRSPQTPTHTIKVRSVQSLLPPGRPLSSGLSPHSLRGHRVQGSSLRRRERTPSRNPAESDLVWGNRRSAGGRAPHRGRLSLETAREQSTCPELSSAVPCPDPKQSPCAEAVVLQPPTPGGGNTSKNWGAHIWRLKPLLCLSPQLAASFFSDF